MENNNNNKRTYRLGILLLVFTLLSTVMLPGTFAKYTSVYAGSDTALVAKWDVTVADGNENMLAATGKDTLNLFEHLYKTNIKQQDGGDYIIAPGVDGKFALVTTNNSDVAADITYEFTEKTGNADVPMEFKAEGKDWTSSLVQLATDLATTNVALGGNETVEVQWRWAFEGDDAKDTALGQASAASPRTNYALNVKVTATQVMPTTN